MTTRNLDALFAPRSISLVGASQRPGSVGAVLAANLSSGGFKGSISAVSLHSEGIAGLPTYRTLGAAPPADLVVIATPPGVVPQLLGEAAERGARAAVVITAGLSDEPLRQQMLDQARRYMLRIVGPNCLGVLSPTCGVNASFAHLMPQAGGLALVAQSGAVATAAMDWAVGRGFGFSHVVTLGDMADVDFGDLLDYLSLDPATNAILLYVESVTSARKFMSAARAASRVKPVVVVKAGRSRAGASAAFSHTRALAGSDIVYDAVFRRAGMIRVPELREMFDAVATLTSGVKVAGDRLAIVTNGGGAGVMAVDALDAAGGRLAQLNVETVAALDERLPRTWSRANPVDIIGDAPPERYASVLEILDGAPDIDAILVLNCPTALASGADAARLMARRPAGSSPPLLTCWLGDPAAREGRAIFARAGIPSFETPEEAVRAFGHLAQRERNRQLLMQTPPASAFTPDKEAARAILAGAQDGALTEPEAKRLLAAYGIPALVSLHAAEPAGAAEASRRLTPPFALKIISPDINHKSDVGGVALSLESAEAVLASAQAMQNRLRVQAPGARLRGFIVQQMILRPRARELIVGLASDPTFGPVVMFGAGGVEVEVLADRVMGLPPLNRWLALDMIDRTEVARRLRAFRGRPAADLEGIAEVLTRLSQLALDFPEIGELDINPLLADEDGVLALDARVRLTDSHTTPAIAPYPQGLTREIDVGGLQLIVRPILPEDEPLLVDLAAKSTLEDLRFRFRAALRELPHDWAARLSQIDYDREMAFVALMGPEIVGVARLAADPEGREAEFALFVRSDLHRRGVGSALMNALIGYAAGRGVVSLWGEVLADNAPMLALSRRLGFVGAPVGEGLVRVTRVIEKPAP